MRKAGSGSRRASGRRPIRTSASKGSDHPSAKLTPIEQSNRHLSMYDPEDRQDHADQHLLPHAPSGVRGGCQQHAVDQRRRSAERRHRLAQPQNVRGDRRRSRSRRAGRRSFSTPTATASATKTMSSRTSRSIRPRTSASPAAFYGIGVNPVDGTVWGSVLGFPGYVIRRQSGRKSAGDRHWRKSTSRRCRATGRAAWTSTATASPGRRCRAGIMASFDRRKCKGPLNGPTATGKHCPEGWTLYPFPGPQLQNVNGARQRRGELLHLGRPVRHVRAGQERADRHRQRQRVAARAGQRQVRQSARPLSDGLLRQVDGRPHRRSERRLEGQRAVVDVSATARRSTSRAARARCPRS